MMTNDCDYSEQISRLSPGPQVLARLITLLQRPDLEAGEVITLISFDPALTTKLLQRCNSARYGCDQPADQLDEAVVRLGFNEVYRLVATVIGETALKGPQRGYGFGPGDLWEHSAASAVAAKLIAPLTDADENVLFTAALLHDIGKLILGSFLEDKYHRLVHETEASGHSLVESEKAILGIDHAELGGRVLAAWNFPENLVNGVRYHHDPAGAASYEGVAAAVCVADLIAHLIGHAAGHQSFAVRACSETVELLGIRQTDLESLALETEIALTKNPLFRRAA